jgi:hypothetical protein
MFPARRPTRRQGLIIRRLFGADRPAVVRMANDFIAGVARASAPFTRGLEANLS